MTVNNTKYNKATSDPARAWQNYGAITITASGGLTGYDMAANTTLFSKVKTARELMIRNTQEMSVRFNGMQEDEVFIDPYEGLLISGLPISNIYVTATPGCRFKILLIGWN